MTSELLPTITGPERLRELPATRLPELAQEIRRFLVEKVCVTGGHLGPNLGVVELTIAAHRVFHSPHDVLLFDTGHQAYVHKILTGRQDDFVVLRQAGGLSGYPSRSESPHDFVENSHASTALSYADGLAKAFALRGEHDRHVVAIVGDGATTGGMWWEALNNVGPARDQPMVIVLNDNGRSYAPTIGGLAAHLAGLKTGQEPGNLFEDMGLAYIGPVDGHDIAALEDAFAEAAALRRPVVVHAITVKGKGYLPAEEHQEDCLHAVGAVDPVTAQPLTSGGPTWTSVFAQEIAEIGARRPDVVCITAAMLEPAGLGGFAKRFPNRVFDVGLAEQHAVTSAAGLALGGLHPVVAIYATFVNRAFDQMLMDVALHHLPVTFVLDRAGVTGPDGPSHHGVWDASILPVIPGLRIASPRDASQLRQLLCEAVECDGPTVLRYPKATVGADIPAIREVGCAEVLRDEETAEVLLVATGPFAGPCLAAAEELSTAHDVPATVVDPRWIAPLDPELVKLAHGHRLVLVVEDTTSTSALGTRLGQALAANGATTCVVAFALPARFLIHGTRTEILRAHGLDTGGITATVLKRLNTMRHSAVLPADPEARS